MSTIFTREQFDKAGPFYLDDAPFEDVNDDLSWDQDMMWKVFCKMPHYDQCTGITWGLSDTVFRESAYEFVLKELLNMTPEQYHGAGYPKLPIVTVQKWLGG